MSQPPHTPDGRIEVRAIIHGEVQGVGFRFFIRHEANTLGLSGWVRNTPDGSVEVVAQGQRRLLERLVDAARRGPSSARVAEVEVKWCTPLSTIAGFTIRR